MKKIIETPNRQKYLISITEEYFARVHKGWKDFSRNEKIEVVEKFMAQVESFILNTAATGIASMSFIDENLELKSAITICTIPDNDKLDFLQREMREKLKADSNNTPIWRNT